MSTQLSHHPLCFTLVQLLPAVWEHIFERASFSRKGRQGRMFKFLGYCWAVAFIASASPTPLDRVPPPPGFNVCVPFSVSCKKKRNHLASECLCSTSGSFLGSGCSPSSASYSLDGDKEGLTVTFSNFYAEVGTGIPLANNRRNCQLAIGVQIPPGFAFGIQSIEAASYRELASKVTLSQFIDYYFQGQDILSSTRSESLGPVPGHDGIQNFTFDLASTVVSPCNRDTALNLIYQARLSDAQNASGSGLLEAHAIHPVSQSVSCTSTGVPVRL